MAVTPDCQLCPRLADYRKQQKLRYPDYHNRPVQAIGKQDARLLIVGLAPGLHGANASGIPFTGDASGAMLFESLHKHAFADSDRQAVGIAPRLLDCRITNAVKCLPPANRPSTEEIDTCSQFLRAEIASLKPDSVILSLGGIAHRSIVRSFALSLARKPFGHLAEHSLPGNLKLIDSYHCSRYNTNTGRLTQSMFDAVFIRIRQLLQ